jgi:hypothetical protein
MLAQLRVFPGAHLSRGVRRGRKFAHGQHVMQPNDGAPPAGSTSSQEINTMYTRSLASVALVAAAVLVSSSARAQSATAVEQVMIGVSMQTKRLDTALTTLGQIEKGLHGTDAGSVGEVANAGRQFTGAVGEATPVGLILRHMKHPDDIRFTRAILAISASKAVLVANTDAEIINRYLPQIATPAAAAESTKIRDAILETRNLLEAFAQVPE